MLRSPITAAVVGSRKAALTAGSRARMTGFWLGGRADIPSAASAIHIFPRRWYTPMTAEEQEKEKARVTHLSSDAKDLELRDLNRQIARLEMLRGINTGELYTWSGRYKVLMRDYAFPLFAYYWSVWATMGAGVYLAIGIGGLDAMQVIGWFDGLTGLGLAEKVDPTFGTTVGF